MPLSLIFLIFFAVCAAVFVVAFLFKAIGYLYPYFFWGAIYVPTSDERVGKMIKLLEIKPGQTAVDLGAGDGRMVIALASKGVKAYGCEINPFLVSRARKNIKKAGLEGKAFIYCKNMWQEDLKNFDAVVVYGMRHMMKKLQKKLEKELKPGARVVSNYFVFPDWKPDKSEDKIFLYKKIEPLENRL